MAGYTKLHSTILDSSVWAESIATRIVWITMLAMADQNGIVQASTGGLARRANVTREECDEALAVFLGPDPDSRDGTTGERIEKVAGGWLVLNHANYREKQTREQEQTALRVARHRAKQSVTCNDVTDGNGVKRRSASVSESEAASAAEEKENQEEKKKAPRKRGAFVDEVSKPDDVMAELWDAWMAVRKRKGAPLSEVAWAGVLRETAKAGWHINEVVRKMAERNWQSVEAAWLAKEQSATKVTASGRVVVEASKVHIPNMPLGSEFCDCPGCAAAKLTRSLSDAKNVSNHMRTTP